MNKNYYSPICRRNDGSVYIDRNRCWKDFIGGATAILLLVLFFTAIVMFGLVGSESPHNENDQRGEVSRNNFAKSAE